MSLVKEIAPAKINLFLQVTGKYDNGYHKLETIMQSVDLYDELTLTAAGECIDLSVKGMFDVPENSSNLAWQAAELMKQKFEKVDSGLQIELSKKIPVSAGLAGGSADAAAVIRGINRLFSLGLSATTMEKLALELGADVPFCIRGGTALACGRGEKLTFLPTPDMKNNSLLLINPQIAVSTEEIFAQVSREDFSRKTKTAKFVNLLLSDREINWTEGWKNDLEQITFSLYPCLEDLKEKILMFEPRYILMTGSGPTLVVVLDSEKKAAELENNWDGKEKIFLVNFLNCDEANTLS